MGYLREPTMSLNQYRRTHWLPCLWSRGPRAMWIRLEVIVVEVVGPSGPGSQIIQSRTTSTSRSFTVSYSITSKRVRMRATLRQRSAYTRLGHVRQRTVDTPVVLNSCPSRCGSLCRSPESIAASNRGRRAITGEWKRTVRGSFRVSIMQRSGAYQCELLELTENSRLRRSGVDDLNQSRSACVWTQQSPDVSWKGNSRPPLRRPKDSDWLAAQSCQAPVTSMDMQGSVLPCFPMHQNWRVKLIIQYFRQFNV